MSTILNCRIYIKVCALIFLVFIGIMLYTQFLFFPNILNLNDVSKAKDTLTLVLSGFFTILLISVTLILRHYVSSSKNSDKEQGETTFLANMSHEIRAPMNGLIGAANLLQKEPLNDLQLKYAKIINQSGQNLLTLLNEILDYSKIKAGKYQLHSEAFDLFECIDHIYNLFSLTAQEKNIKLQLTCGKIPLALVGDNGSIRQVLTNFLSNALKFTEKGRIVVSVDVENLNEHRAVIKFSVTDTGIGIPKDKQDGVFKVFEQVSGSSVVRSGGTGLGMFISKFLAESMGGEIGFESIENKGSTFWLKVDLPIASTEESYSIIFKDEITELPEFNASILLVEDSRVNRFIISDALERLGCNVDTAEDGQQAVDKFFDKKYDMVFMDCKMPIMDGLEATKIIREKETSLNQDKITIVALTGGVAIKDKKECTKAGMNDVLPKPVVVEDFIPVLDKFLPNTKTKDAGYQKGENIISWSDKFSMQIPSIDIQHKQIIKYINTLHNAIINKKSNDVLEPILNNLLSYTYTHFAYEEKFFIEFNYEHTKDHCKKHTELKLKVLDFIDKYKSGEEDITEDFFIFLKKWLIVHIMTDDAMYLKCFKEHGL